MIPDSNPSLLIGEFSRKLDERFRLSVPPELAEPLWGQATQCVLAKERPGCLSVWNLDIWQARLQPAIELVEAKLRAGKLEQQSGSVQQLGRLLSTRHRTLDVAGRSRLLIPEGFREFLQVEAGSDVIVVGAAVCVEIWRPARWLEYLERRMPRFRRLLDQLSA